ncbi:GNAT family N-acetyltransferase [Streptacidiphilus melanogenes]|uniref:GNAT family N-acetyltransferase n=1 Tax=Streptacidiphilus melanogenes TaxID=411235 RepID=UPI001269D7BF|nr:GNAT family N-acetyltransferase [Streptacidiphilus melanogenes]
MSLEVAPFTPERASPEELREWYELLAEVSVADFPNDPVVPHDTYVRRLRESATSLRVRRHWEARDAGRLVGPAAANFRTGENSGYVDVALRVPTQNRGSGIATELLRAVLPEIHAHDCHTISGEVITGTAGEQLTNALGFRTVLRLTSHHLDVTTTDRARWQAEPAPGFRLRQWTDAAPDDLIQSFVHARNTMADQPLGDMSFKYPVWTVERVRQLEADLLKAGQSRRYVAAIDERNGVVAGFTEIAINPGQESHCHQVDTGVLPEFRGLGLGLAMKSSMMRWLTADLPHLAQVDTMTASENTHMIDVNTQLGYEPAYTLASVETDPATLESRLNPSSRLPTEG